MGRLTNRLWDGRSVVDRLGPAARSRAGGRFPRRPPLGPGGSGRRRDRAAGLRPNHMGGGEWMLYDLADRQSPRRQHDEAEAAYQAEVLQEFPEMLHALAFVEPPEIRKPPELVEQHRRYHAEPPQNEGGKPAMPPRHNADRRTE